jgi:hypothetical protein
MEDGSSPLHWEEKISGILAGFWDKFDNKAVFFAISAVAAIIACFLLLPLAKRPK